MSEMLWKIGEDHQIREHIIAQDLNFQKAMRTELRELAKERGIKVAWKQDPESIPAPKTDKRVRDVLRIVTNTEQREPIAAEKWKSIFQEVCEKHKVTATLIRGAQRARYIVKARQEMAYRLSQETEMSLPQIARKMGYLDHTVVIHSIRKYRLDNGLEHPNYRRPSNEEER